MQEGQLEEQGDQSTFLPLFSLHPFERGKSYLKLKDEKIHLERKKKKKKAALLSISQGGGTESQLQS